MGNLYVEILVVLSYGKAPALFMFSSFIGLGFSLKDNPTAVIHALETINLLFIERRNVKPIKRVKNLVLNLTYHGIKYSSSLRLLFSLDDHMSSASDHMATTGFL